MRSATLRSLLPPLLACITLAVLASPAPADDRQLLRFDTQKPYLFVVFDNSGSMASQPGDPALPGAGYADGDDPASKLGSAKSVAYDVFSSVADVQFGFATFNQDDLRVVGKHWLYTAAPGTAALVAANLPVAFPSADGEPWVFGTFLPAGTADLLGAGLSAGKTNKSGDTLGSPSSGVSLSKYQTLLDRFPKLQLSDDNGNRLSDTTDSSLTTTLYIAGTGNTIYQYTISRVTGTTNLGDPTGPITVHVAVNQCTNAACNVAAGSVNLTFKLVTAFFMNEGSSTSGATTDNRTGYWAWSDVIQDSGGVSTRPFSGQGIEGNYDGTFTNPPLPQTGVQARFADYDTSQPGGSTSFFDPYNQLSGTGCLPVSNGTSSSCTLNLKYPTTIAPAISGLNASTATLDSGDLLPLNWNNTNQTALLNRFAPNQASGTPDFGQADYFMDAPGLSGFFRLRGAGDEGGGMPPLLAAGPSPLAAVVDDFRCYYMGQGPGAKCNNVGNYTTPWDELAASQDSSWGCRKPYLIVLTDGTPTQDNTNNPCADTADLNSKAGIQTWVIAYGADCSKIGNPMKCMAQNGKGQLLCPQNRQTLKDELTAILGKIREQTRAFASAAVPSVQATISDKIFLSDFTPAQGISTWEGRVNAFLKPLPLDPTTGKPDTSTACAAWTPTTDQTATPPSPRSQCFLWDSGVQMKSQVPAAPATPVGMAATQRRIYYAQQTTAGSWAGSRRFLLPITDTGATSQSDRYDLWRAFGIAFQPDNPTADPAAQAYANGIIANTEAMKTHSFTDPVTGTVHTDSYILGDIFHSNPLIIGTPPNVKAFAVDLNTNGGTCDADSSKNTETGYRCFESRHANRRKLLVVGSNDGMLHAFDAGLPHLVTMTNPSGVQQVQFDDGTGKEVWAYMPRAVMPTVKTIACSDATCAQQGTQQHWTVDGAPQAGDVFIDPAQTGTPDPTKREWRTVVIAGLREGPERGGNNGYYALDVTQPDPIVTTTDPTIPFVPKATSYVAGCDPGSGPLVSGCGPVPYPAPLWEFYDQAHNADGSTALDASNNPVLLDEDGNGTPDLGHTWSIPTIGRIQIADASGKTIDKYVSIFGGGLDAGTKTLDSPAAGNWIYIVDIETGRAIYKRQILGGAPSTAAAVDTNQDGVIDRIYVGTTSGHMYRVDLTPNALGHLPQLNTVSVKGFNTTTMYTESRITVDPDDPAVTAWAPREIFNANFNGTTALLSGSRSIYYDPAVIFDANLGLYALAFGTGDREDLWSTPAQQERYYMFMDDSDLLAPSALPLNESDLTAVSFTAANTTANYLETGLPGHRGWYMTLDPSERVITDSFALSGVNTFSTYQPTVCIGTLQPDGTCLADRNQLCSKTGTSRIFVTFTTNANAALYDAVGSNVRAYNVSTFVTAPYTEQAQTKNPSASGGGTTSNADQLTAPLLSVMNTLKQLFPANCRFGNSRIDIKTITGDTGVIFIAPVPVCIIEKNWKEY